MFTRIPAANLLRVFLAPPAAAEQGLVTLDGNLQAVINKDEPRATRLSCRESGVAPSL